MPVRASRLVFAGTIALFLAVVACNGGGDPDRHGNFSKYGVVVFYNGYVGVVDPAGRTVAEPYLTGRIGSPDNSVDVALSPDGRTALVSSFQDNTVFIFDMSDPSAPGAPDNVDVGFRAEDIAVAPDGRYALVTGGIVTQRIAVIDVARRAPAGGFTSTVGAGGYAPAHQAVAVAADGRTVLTVDYFGGRVNTLLLDSAGRLTYVGSIAIRPDNTLRPVNVSISPDGRTAVVAAVATGVDNEARVANMGFPVLRITAPGAVEWAGLLKTGGDFVGAQSIAFSRDGRRAYAYCNRPDPIPPVDDTNDPFYPWDAIVALDVTGPGAISDAGIAIPVAFRHTGYLFGADTLAVAPGDRDLYVSNMNVFLASSRVQVVDLETRSVAKTIDFDDGAIPVGIYFAGSSR